MLVAGPRIDFKICPNQSEAEIVFFGSSMRILILSDVDADALDRINQRHEIVDARGVAEQALPRLASDCDVIVFRSGVQVGADLMRHAPNLRLVIRAGSGIDNLDLDYIQTHGIRLARIPKPGAFAVAELTFAAMLALSRNLLEADAGTRRGAWLKHKLDNYLLRGKTLGVVGAGNIGSQVGRMGAAWGMRVVGCVETLNHAVERKLAALGIEAMTLGEVAVLADYISIHVPLQDSTRHLIGRDFLSRTKPGAYLINMARGGVVDEEALHEWLVRTDGLRGAALDVHENEGPGKISPLADLKNVILTPHMGATTIDTQREIGKEIESVIEAEFRLIDLPVDREA